MPDYKKTLDKYLEKIDFFKIDPFLSVNSKKKVSSRFS